jgi:Flagellar-associated PapD-like
VMTMQGMVEQQVAATPAQVAFGTVRKGAAATQEVTIDDLTAQKGFKVSSVSNSSPSIKVAIEPRKDGKPGALLKVDLLPTMPAGNFDDAIKVTTNRAPLQIDVFGTVAGDLTLDPAQVSFGIVPKGQDVVRILRLTNSSPRDVKVLDISSSTPSVVASADPVKAGREYRITVTLRRGTPDGQLRGQLAIKTDDPEQSKVDVPFYAIVGQFKI